MSVLPYMPFFPSDWIRDTRCLCVATRGVWVDILCELWHAPQRGTKTMTIAQWARAVGCSTEEFKAALQELESQSIPNITRDSDAQVTLLSRRMIRDEKVRELKNLRQKKYRDKEARDGVVDASVTPYISEVISQKSEEEKKKKEKNRKGSAEGKRRRSVFPDGFTFSLEHTELAQQLGLNVAVEFAHFRDHHIAKGTVFLDWSRAFNTWLRRATSYRRAT